MNTTGEKVSILLRVPVQWIIFICQGIILVFFNLVIVGTVAKYKQLREKKEFIIFGALALADGFAGFGYFLLGNYSIWIVYKDQVNVKMSSWSCMMRPHNWFLGFGGPMSGFMLVCVSLDRLISVAAPIKYFKCRTRYAWKLVGGFYIYGVVSFLYLLVTSYLQPDTSKYSSLCQTPKAIGDQTGKQYFLLTRVLSGLLSVLIYFLVVPFYKRSTKIFTNNSIQTEQQIKQNLERQRRLSVTVGICVFFTFVLFVLPTAAKFWFNTKVVQERGTIVVALIGYASCIQNMNPILNIFLYALKLQDMRKGIKSFLLCKGIPIDASG